jgi:hypothetical protein
MVTIGGLEEYWRRREREDRLFAQYADRYHVYRGEAAQEFVRAVRDNHDPGDEDRSER